MKILIFGTVKEEQAGIRDELISQGMEQVDFSEGILTMETVSKTKGYDLVWLITNSIIGEAEAKALEDNQVKYIVTRSTGIDHLAIDALKKHHILASNVPVYSTGAVSEHTMMLLLALLRKLKESIRNTDHGDFTLNHVMARELSELTVGIVGCGKIAMATMRMLSGFGCRILVSAPHKKPEAEGMAEFTETEHLLKESDVVILHCPLKQDTYHMIDRDRLKLMKKDAILINTARGGLVDAGAVLAALKQHELAGFGFDVYEKEDDYIRTVSPDYEDAVFWELYHRDDVIYTSHIAFYTDTAVNALNRETIKNVLSYQNTGASDNEITI